jgi:predicted membrane protein
MESLYPVIFVFTVTAILLSSYFIAAKLYKYLVASHIRYAAVLSVLSFIISAAIIAAVILYIIFRNIDFIR